MDIALVIRWKGFHVVYVSTLKWIVGCTCEWALAYELGDSAVCGLRRSLHLSNPQWRTMELFKDCIANAMFRLKSGQESLMLVLSAALTVAPVPWVPLVVFLAYFAVPLVPPVV